MENLVIRKIRVEDADEIRRIQVAITKRKYDIDYHQSIKAAISGEQNVTVAAEVGGMVVGYMISYMMFGGFGLPKSAWITDFGVDPKYMGQGIGKSLAEKVLTEYEKSDVTHVYTAVQWDSVDILSFFRTLGFDRSIFINLRKKLT